MEPLGLYGPDPSPLVFDDGSGGAATGDGTLPPYAEPTPPPEILIDPGVILVDPPRTWSLYCGDGAWDPTFEECDAGAVALENTSSVCSANCQTRDVLVVEPAVSGRDASRHLGLGRHPLAGNQLVGALAWVEHGAAESLPTGTGSSIEGSVPQVIVQTLDLHGSPGARLVVADENYAALGAPNDTALVGNHPVLASNPVVAALPDGSIAVAYNDLNGDGSELGVAFRQLTQAEDNSWLVGGVSYINETTLGAQADADLVWTRSGLVAAWVDFSEPLGPRIVSRQLSTGASGSSNAEVQLAAPGPALGAVALSALPAVFDAITGEEEARTWAAVYRQGEANGAEGIVVYSDGPVATIRPGLLGGVPSDIPEQAPQDGMGGAVEPVDDRVMPGHLEDRPAVAPLSESLVAVAFTVGTDPLGTGVASAFRLWMAVVDLETGIVEGVVAIEPQDASTSGQTDDDVLSMRQPSLVSSGIDGQVYVAWRSEGRLGDARGEDLWLKRIEWDSSSGSLDLSHAEVSLQRDENKRGGDQRTPALAAMMVPGDASLEAPALGMAWEDWGVQYDDEQARPDVLVQVAPTPMRRGPPVESDCTGGNCGIGEGPCFAGAGEDGCVSGLVCAEGRGPYHGLGYTTPVCELATCDNGVQDGDEVDEDCGGSCGVCFNCPDATTFAGTANYCSLVCPCSRRDGDCDFDFECDDALNCQHQTGALVGLPAAIDLCDFDHCHNGQLDTNEEKRDCGGSDCRPCVNGTPENCVDVACTVGQGDCLAPGATCDSGLVCDPNGGASFGLPVGVGVCAEPTCPMDRGLPNTAGFCSSDCQCPGGWGTCDDDNECADSECIEDIGIYFGLDSTDNVCMPSHCFDGEANYGESMVDCGGDCGTECPSCLSDPGFGSFEDLSQWGDLVFLPAGMLPSGSISSSTTASAGLSSMAYTACNFKDLASQLIDGQEFAVVGDELWLDVQFQVGAGGSSWDWLGNLGVVIWVDGTEYEIHPEESWTRDDAQEWRTLKMPLPTTVQNAFASGTSNLQVRIAVNRNCGVAGAGGGAILLDNLRFAGQSAFRSDCEPDAGGSGGSGSGGAGSGGAGSGGAGSGGAGSGGAGSGGAGSGGAGSGGAGSGGAGSGGMGTGGASTNPEGTAGAAADVFGFEDLSLWSNGAAPDVDATQADQSMEMVAGWQVYDGGPFGADEVEESSILLVDIKFPPPVDQWNVLQGDLVVSMSCPSAGLFNQTIGSLVYNQQATEIWGTHSLTVPQAVQNALGSSATDCTVRLRSNLSNQFFGGVILVDNLRFAPLSHCTEYTQQATVPFSLGMPIPPNGTSDFPYPLCNVSQLQEVANNVGLRNKHFRLEFDIDVSSLIGRLSTLSNPFTGTFDGQNHVLSNYSYSGSNQSALFGVVTGDGVLDGVNDGVIKNLTIVNSIISGNNGVSALVGLLQSGSVSNVTVTASQVSSTGSNVGGIVGRTTGFCQLSSLSSDVALSASNGSDVGGVVGELGSNGVLSLSSASNDVSQTGSGANIGGLVGFNAGAIFGCEAMGSVNAGASAVGGLVGLLDGGTIEESVAYGNITGSGNAQGGAIGLSTNGAVDKTAAFGAVLTSGARAGGLVGEMNSGSVTDCHSRGDTSASSGAAGGLVGQTDGATITRAFSMGAATGNGGSSAGALIGNTVGATTNLTGCFAHADVNPGLDAVGNNSSPGDVSLATLSQLQNQSTYVGWDFMSVWLMGTSGAELQ